MIHIHRYYSQGIKSNFLLSSLKWERHPFPLSNKWPPHTEFRPKQSKPDTSSVNPSFLPRHTGRVSHPNDVFDRAPCPTGGPLPLCPSDYPILSMLLRSKGKLVNTENKGFWVVAPCGESSLELDWSPLGLLKEHLFIYLFKNVIKNPLGCQDWVPRSIVNSVLWFYWCSLVFNVFYTTVGWHAGLVWTKYMSKEGQTWMV